MVLCLSQMFVREFNLSGYWTEALPTFSIVSHFLSHVSLDTKILFSLVHVQPVWNYSLTVLCVWFC